MATWFRFLFGAVIFSVFAGCTEFQDLEIVTSSLPEGRAGQVYAGRIETRGGYGSLTLRVLSGQLPPGVGFRQHDEDAELDGTPVLAGDYLFTVEARDGHDTLNQTTIVSKGFLITVRD